VIGAAFLLLLAPPPGPFQYALSPGTHLVYEERLEHSQEGPDASLLVRAAFTSHVLVLGETVGFERVRTKAELVRYTEDGRDERKREGPAFDAQVAERPVRFAEANRLTPSGLPRFQWDIHREWPSELLYEVHEIEPLPGEMTPGTRSSPGTPLGLRFEVVGRESVLGRDCVAVRAEAEGALKLHFDFSPELHAIVRLQMEGTYSIFGQRVRETLDLSLVDVRHDETVDAWLRGEETRRGVLAALLVSERETFDRGVFEGLFAGGAPDLDRAALALLYRAHLPAPAQEVRARLLRPDVEPRIRALALRSLEGLRPSAEVKAAVEAGLGAKNDAVRDAALHYLTERLASGDAASITASTALERWDRLSPLPLPREGADWVRAVEGRGDLPGWVWGPTENWSRRAALAKRCLAPSPGFTLRAMETAPYQGWPYVMRVPEEYRGDEPFPLIVMLGGGPGRAVQGALSVRDALSKTPALALFPQAEDLWWEPRSTALVPVLLKEVLRSFNVDTNRVYLTGFSNGGTGTFDYATLWPERLAAAVSLMGAGPFVSGGGDAPFPANLGALPILFLHGDQDPIIPSRASVDTASLVRKEAPEAHVELEILKGLGHEITLARAADRTLSFLDGRRRDPYPRRVHLAIRDLAFPRRYWVRVTEKDGGTAEVTGTIREDSTLVLETRRVKHLELLLRRELLPKEVFSVLLNGKPAFSGRLVEDTSLLASSYRESLDPYLAYGMRVPLTP
jgi:hypothetical protein